MPAILELHLNCAAGREVECAKHLASQLRGVHWEILAALAAEIVAEHENRTGATVVVVATPEAADRVVADLRRGPTLPAAVRAAVAEMSPAAARGTHSAGR